MKTRKNSFYFLLLLVLSLCLPISISTTLWAAGNTTTPDTSEVENYWQLPIPFQGKAPQSNHPLTHDLSPKSCGLCHKKQYDEWQDSWHAKAASPGLLGQLHYFDQESSESCLTCHIPRSEQLQQWQQQPNDFQGTGIDCASCHMRQHQRYGRNNKPTTPHGIVKKKDLFKQADFCSPCHQFTEGKGLKLAGIFLENTHQEWQQSSWSKQGVTCQGCHMSQGSHRFRGIHDADMTRRAFKIEAVREEKGFRLALTNQYAGHALPTYATPRIIVTLKSNTEEKQHIIQRELFLDDQQSLQQKQDTRLQPHQTLTLFLALTPEQKANAVIRVEPDHLYQQVIYPYFLDDDSVSDESDDAENNEMSKEEQHARHLLRQAKDEKRDYTLYDIQCPTWQQKNQDCTLSPTRPTGEPILTKKPPQ